MQFFNFSLRFDEVNWNLKVLSLYLKKYPRKNTPLLRLRATRSDLIFRLTRLHINVRIFFRYIRISTNQTRVGIIFTICYMVKDS